MRKLILIFSVFILISCNNTDKKTNINKKQITASAEKPLNKVSLSPL